MECERLTLHRASQVMALKKDYDKLANSTRGGLPTRCPSSANPSSLCPQVPAPLTLATVPLSAAKQQRVDELHDSLKQIDLQAPGPEDEDQMTKQIRPLENRLDKAMIKYNEAQNIRRTYEQVSHGAMANPTLTLSQHVLRMLRVRPAPLVPDCKAAAGRAHRVR